MGRGAVLFWLCKAVQVAKAARSRARFRAVLAFSNILANVCRPPPPLHRDSTALITDACAASAFEPGRQAR